MPGDAIAAIVKRRASAPMSSITDSDPHVAFDLLIFWRARPGPARDVHGVERHVAGELQPSMIIRATQKKMMSNPVSSSVVGSSARVGRLLGPAMVLKARGPTRTTCRARRCLAQAPPHVHRPVFLEHERVAAAVAVPRRNAVAPPQLPRDAPVVMFVIHSK